MPELAKVVYRPIGLLASLGAAAIAGRIVKVIWKQVRHEEDVPGALQSEYSMAEVVAAAAVQAVIFGIVHAVIDRVGARVFERVTGEWPGD